MTSASSPGDATGAIDTISYLPEMIGTSPNYYRLQESRISNLECYPAIRCNIQPELAATYNSVVYSTYSQITLKHLNLKRKLVNL